MSLHDELVNAPAVPPPIVGGSPRLRTGRVAGLPAGRNVPGLVQRSKRMADLLAEAMGRTIGRRRRRRGPHHHQDGGGGGVAAYGRHGRRSVIWHLPRGAGHRPRHRADARRLRGPSDDRRARALAAEHPAFLASMCFIRGSARSLPPGVLRRGRAKLARLLARRRVHVPRRRAHRQMAPATRRPARRRRRARGRGRGGGARVAGVADAVGGRRLRVRGAVPGQDDAAYYLRRPSRSAARASRRSRRRWRSRGKRGRRRRQTRVLAEWGRPSRGWESITSSRSRAT